MGEISTMRADEGDIRLIWDASRPDEVKSARQMFEDYTKKGYWAFSVKKDGSQGARITEFDEDAEKIIMTPQVRGG